MDDDDKPVRVERPTDIDFVGIHPSDGGIAIFSFVLDGPADIVLELTPEVLSKLETRLAEIREKLASRRPLQ